MEPPSAPTPFLKEKIKKGPRFKPAELWWFTYTVCVQLLVGDRSRSLALSSKPAWAAE